MPTVAIDRIGTMEFPDSMSLDEIGSAIRDKVIPQFQDRQGQAPVPSSDPPPFEAGRAAWPMQQTPLTGETFQKGVQAALDLGTKVIETSPGGFLLKLIPDVPHTTPEDIMRRNVEGVPIGEPMTESAAQTRAGVINAFVDLLNFAKSPVGVASLVAAGPQMAAAGLAGKVVAYGVRTGFAGMMTQGTVESYKGLQEAAEAGDEQAAAGHATAFLLNVLPLMGGAAMAARPYLAAKAVEATRPTLGETMLRKSQEPPPIPEGGTIDATLKPWESIAVEAPLTAATGAKSDAALTEVISSPISDTVIPPKPVTPKPGEVVSKPISPSSPKAEPSALVEDTRPPLSEVGRSESEQARAGEVKPNENQTTNAVEPGVSEIRPGKDSSVRNTQGMEQGGQRGAEAAAQGEVITRFTHKDGKGLLDRSAWDLSKLTESEELALPELLDYGLEQPRGVPGGSKFYFTKAGLEKHAKLLRLIRKASRSGGLVKEVSKLESKPVWKSNDGQLAISPPVKESATPPIKSSPIDSSLGGEAGKESSPVVNESSQETIRVKNPYGLAPENEKIQTVTGKTIRLKSAPDLEFFVYKTSKNGQWRVVEKSTGQGVGSNGRTRAEAIAKAEEMVTTFGPEKMPGLVASIDKLNEPKSAELAKKNQGDSMMESRGPGAAAGGEPGSYRPAQELADRISTLGKGEPIKERLSLIDRVKLKAETVKDAFTEGLAKAIAVKDAVWDAFTQPPKWTDEKQAAGDWFAATQRSDHEARMLGKSIQKAVPSKLRREAITNWIQAEGDRAVLEERASKSKGAIRVGYEEALRLTPREIEVAEMLQRYFDQQLERGIGEGILANGVDAYVNQVWKRENPITKALRNEFSAEKLPPNFRFARKRIFDSYFEGEQAGYKPANKDVAALVGLYDQAFNRTIAARAYIKALHEGKASDGRPLVEVSGSGKVIGEEEGKPAVLITPKSRPEETSDYRTIDHPAMRGWKWATKTPDGTAVMLKGDLLVHPEAFAKLRNRLSVSAWRQNPVGRAVLNVQSTLKQTMLSISGFHQAQETIHSLGHRVNPANLEKLDFENPLVKDLTTHGLQLADYHAMEAFADGLASGPLTNKIPGLGDKILKPYTEYLFQDLIPRLKLTMAKHALERNLKRYPNLSRDQVLELTASQANAAFGELPYKFWGRNPTLQDSFRAFLLAPDFLEARGRFVAQGVKPFGAEQLQALGLIAATTYITARITNQILDDDPHWESKHAFSIILDGHAYTLRTVPGDVVHMLSDSRRFWYNRLSPIIGRGGIELATSRDDRGVKRGILEQVSDMLKQAVPISLRRRDDQKIWESFLNAFGVQNQRFTAEDEIRDLAKKFTEEHGKKEAFEFIYDPEKDEYRELRTALRNFDEATASKALAKLLETHTRRQISDSVNSYLNRSFTGSKKLDSEFSGTLTEPQKAALQEAKDARQAQRAFFRSLP